MLARFENGVCRTESYQKKSPMPLLDADVSALLRANAGGGKWQKLPNATGRRPVLVLYRGSDNRVAVHDTVRHTLHFSKEEVVFRTSTPR